MSPRLLVVLLSTVNLIAGVAIGIVVDRTVLTERRWGGRGGRPDPARELEKKLDLDAEQAKKVREIFAACRPQFEACMREVQPKLDALRQESNNQIRALLRPDQQARFDELRKEWQQHGHHGDHDRERGRGEASVGSETQTDKTQKEGVR